MHYYFQKGVRLLEIAAETARLLAAVDASAQPRLLELAKEYRLLIQVRLAYFGFLHLDLCLVNVCCRKFTQNCIHLLEAKARTWWRPTPAT